VGFWNSSTVRNSKQLETQCFRNWMCLSFQVREGRNLLCWALHSLELRVCGREMCPGVYSASNINEYQKQKKKFKGSKVRPVRAANNLTAIYEPIV
jgi:hypothetical protein